MLGLMFGLMLGLVQIPICWYQLHKMLTLRIDKGSPRGALYLGTFIHNHGCNGILYMYYERSYFSLSFDIQVIVKGRKLKSGHREIQIFTFISISILFAMIR